MDLMDIFKPVSSVLSAIDKSRNIEKIPREMFLGVHENLTWGRREGVKRSYLPLFYAPPQAKNILSSLSMSARIKCEIMRLYLM